jgi:glycosyltransferase involved in cell wall biosynthesis
MKWIIAAPYTKQLNDGLWTVIQEQDKSLELTISPASYTHNRSRPQSSLKDWKDYWLHASDAWVKAYDNEAGIITAFPQLPVCVGIRKRLSRKAIPTVAYTFNLGSLHGKHKRLLATSALKSVNKFIVHSSEEIINYSRYLNLPVSKFEFIPLAKPIMSTTAFEDKDKPFILAMGSANRDYETLFSAIKKLGYPLTVVAPAHSLSGLDIPPSVTIKSNLSLADCRDLIQKSRINIIPIDNEYTASGQVTLIEAMMFKKAVIATDSIGTRDYIINNKTGYLIRPKSVTDLTTMIDILWNDDKTRNAVAQQAQEYVRNELSDETIAKRLIQVLHNI